MLVEIICAGSSAIVAVIVSLGIQIYGGIYSVLLSFPSVIVVDSIALTMAGEESTPEIQKIKNAQKITSAFAISVLLNIIYVFLWSIFPRFYSKLSTNLKIFLTALTSLSIWGILSAPFIFFREKLQDYWTYIAYGCFAIGMVFTLYLCAVYKRSVFERKKLNYVMLIFTFIIVFAWRMVIFEIKKNEKTISGILILFPFILTIIFATVAKANGKLAISAVAPLCLGMNSASVFGIAYSFFLDYMNLWLSALLATISGIMIINLPGFVYLLQKKIY